MAVAVIAFSIAGLKTSGAVPPLPAADAAPEHVEGGDASASGTAGSYVTRRGCADARRGLAYYRRWERTWRQRMGAAWEPARAHSRSGCPRYLAKIARRKAQRARKAYERWSYQWEWQRWLPLKWQRIGACETGYGKRPGRWDWNSGTYQGAFGFWYGTWDAYKPRGAPSEAFLATPREQYECALNVYAAHGYGAWGCGGA